MRGMKHTKARREFIKLLESIAKEEIKALKKQRAKSMAYANKYGDDAEEDKLLMTLIFELENYFSTKVKNNLKTLDRMEFIPFDGENPYSLV